MANLSQTITNGIGLFGPAPSDKWNVYAWNAFLWGEGTADPAVSFGKALSASLTLSDSLAKEPAPVIANSLSPTSDMTTEALLNGDDFYRLFPGNVTNGESRVSSTWSAGSSTSPSWTQGTASSTSWSSNA